MLIILQYCEYIQTCIHFFKFIYHANVPSYPDLGMMSQFHRQQNQGLELPETNRMNNTSPFGQGNTEILRDVFF